MPSSRSSSRSSSASSQPPSPASLTPLLRLALEEQARRRSQSTPTSGSIPDYSRYRLDPVGFILEVLGDEPWGKQAEIAAALARDKMVTVRSCNGAGKTFLAARLVLWFLLTRRDSTVITTAPTWFQVKNLLWRAIRTAHAQAGLPGVCNLTELNLDSEWVALGLSTNDPVSFQGHHGRGGMLFVADEASGIEEAIFEAAQGYLTKPDSHVLLIGNPNFPAGFFFETHRQPGWARFQIAAHDVPPHIMDPCWITQCAELWGVDSPAYQVRVLGEFPNQGDDVLISMRDAAAAQAHCGELEGESGEAVLGADIARYGGDESVAYVRRGDRVIAARYWRGNDTQESAGRIAALARETGATVLYVDEIGVGAGVVDTLKHQRLPVVGVNVGSKPLNAELFLNRRAEVFFGLRDRFREGRISIPGSDEQLFAQLTSLRYRYTPQGKLQLESKEELRKRGLASPDRADALALCFQSGLVHAAAVPLDPPADWFADREFVPWG